MNSLAGKKVLCFIALPHHNRFLVPIMEALALRGMEVKYFTAPAEGAFEITLNQANLPYTHLLDYASAETGDRVSAAMRQLTPVLQEKLLRNRALQGVPVVIQDKVIRAAVENFHCIERMLAVEKPDLIFALHELNPWGKMLGYLSHVYQTPYFTLQEGLYYADTHYYRFHTDYSTACVVWGEECREILLAAGCSDDKIFPLGNTHLWDAKKEFTDTASIQHTYATLGIPPEKKLLLFLMSHSHYRPFEARHFLDWMKARGDVVAVFKWHPAAGKEIVDEALKNLQGAPSVISVYDVDTYALIGASALCATVGNSTTGLEALVFDKPLIEVRLPDQPYSYLERGVAEAARGFEDIGGVMEKLLSEGLSPQRRGAVEKYLAHNFSHRDGSTMSRIVELVEESLQVKSDLAPQSVSSPASTRFPCSIILPVDDCAPELVLATIESLAASTPSDLFEVVLVNCSAQPQTAELIDALGGDVKIIQGAPQWNYATACNRAVSEAQGKYLVFWKPGLTPAAGWLEELIASAEESRDGAIVAGQVLNQNGLIWQIGVAFDVNQSPFAIYRMLPPEFSGAPKPREFKAVEFPFLVSRELFINLGGFNPALCNRFEDIDFCLRAKGAGFRALYTPRSKIILQAASWRPSAAQDPTNRIRFYSAWTGSLWQDDGVYLGEDGLSHDALSAVYREFANRLASGFASIAAVPVAAVS